MSASQAPAPKPSPIKAFGRFELRQLLGKSDRSMCWLVHDPRLGQDLMLTLPRVQPGDLLGLEAWLNEARQAARLNHPNLAHVVEIGEHDHWPYVAVDRALGVTLAEHLEAHRQVTPAEAMSWIVQALQGLAFAHEAGHAHDDLQLHHLIVSEQGSVRVMGLAAAREPVKSTERTAATPSAMPLDPTALRASRHAAQRDVLTAGVLMHRLLAGAWVLDETDTARAIERMPPAGREIVRLPWATPQPVPEALRAIANRATDRQERQRYHNARTLLRALTGWQEAEAAAEGGALALMIDRLRTVGHLPAGPGVGARVARLALAEGQRTDEIAAHILQDVALSFELLRNVNSAQVQGSQMAGSGPVLTVRRAIALVGLKGVRNAAAALRAWPGPLSQAHAADLQHLIDQARLAGHVAQELRPAGYDAEVVYLLATMQNLGRLLVQYHFPDEAAQIRQLMLAVPDETGAEQPGMTEAAASYAVLGIDSEALGAAIARYWGLTEEVLHMVRRIPLERPIRAPAGDADSLRMAASMANDVVDASLRPLPTAPAQGSPTAAPLAAGANAALAAVVQRYGRAMGVGLREVQEALIAARQTLKNGPPQPGQTASTPVAAVSAEPPAPATSEPAPSAFAALMASRQG